MPNIRRLVVPGDHIFVVSGRVKSVQQYIVGGFCVAEKLDALAAYNRFPANRMRKEKDGSMTGNIIVLPDGSQNPVDYHDGFEQRVRNYVVGKDQVMISKPDAVEKARDQSVRLLSKMFGTEGNSIREVMGRWRKLDEVQIKRLRDWVVATEGR